MKNFYTDANISLFRAWFNKMKIIYTNIEMDAEYSFIDTYHKIIYAEYDNGEYAEETKKKVASTIYKYFKMNKNERQAKHYHMLFKTKVDDIINNVYEHNELTDIQLSGWLYMDELKQKINELEETKLSTPTNNLYYLLLNIHYYGALRSSYYFNLLVVDEHKNADNKTNYIMIPKVKKNEAYYWVIDDKVSNTKSHATNNKIILNDELKKVFHESLKAYPRKYLLFEIDNEKDFLKALKKACSKETNNQILRTSYETERYIDEAVINNNYSKFAMECKRLRHNPHIVLSAYIKNINALPKLKNRVTMHYLNESIKEINADKMLNGILEKLETEERAYIMAKLQLIK